MKAAAFPACPHQRAAPAPAVDGTCFPLPKSLRVPNRCIRRREQSSTLVQVLRGSLASSARWWLFREYLAAPVKQSSPRVCGGLLRGSRSLCRVYYSSLPSWDNLKEGSPEG